MEDESTNCCTGCNKKFTMLNRKHHCKNFSIDSMQLAYVAELMLALYILGRRCRDLFCEACTSRTAPILILSIREVISIAGCSDDVFKH
jgi:hypothetical protein